MNTEIMLRVQESGLAIPSDTTLDGKHCPRVAINNHRTKRQDFESFLKAILRIGAELVGEAQTSGWFGKPDVDAQHRFAK